MPQGPKATPSPVTPLCWAASISVLRRELCPSHAASISSSGNPGHLMPAADRKHPLDTFFAPSSIAIIGASRDPTKIPGLLLTFLRKNKFSGRIFPVNPNYSEIDGLTCYPSVSAINAPIDLAIVIIPARAVLGALEECAKVGVKNAIVISSGFAEEGGDSAAMQD